MQARKVLEYLEDLAEKLGVEIVHEKLGWDDFRVKGGLCRVRGTYKIFLDRSEPIEGQIEILARALASFNTDEVYLLPHIRGLLEKARRSS